MKPSAALISLGCSKNLVDSEVMAAQLAHLGYSIHADPSQAALILVNTCGFLESAVQEAIETILDVSRYKESGSCRHLVVAGCMVQRYGKKLIGLMPEVDCYLGTDYCYDVKEILGDLDKGLPKRLWISHPRFLFHGGLPRSLSTPFFTAYVKISEGCSNRCTYCLIPSLRGPLRSRSVDDIVDEVHRLADAGVKEVNLIAQDTTAFGSDRHDPSALIRLMESLDRVPGISWIRVLYAHPHRVGDFLLQTMAQSKKIVPYLDIPFQHCVSTILKAMGRSAAREQPEELVARIRGHLPHIALRTSLMVGFPGETENDFHALADFTERMEFDHLGVFTFSPEPGTPAARFPQRPGRHTGEKRRRILLTLQRSISRRKLASRVGQTVPVLIEGPHPETELLLTGRLASQAPEVDGTVILTRGDARIGDLVLARVTAAHDYDVEAEICDPTSPPPEVEDPSGRPDRES